MTRLFSLWDPQNVGVITHATFREIVQKLPLTPISPPTAVDGLVSYADPGETGTVNYKQFCERLFADYDKAVKAKGP
jgi:Ca2+-binding EF-hand superfamily protein